MAERIKLTEKVLREAVPVVGRDYQIFDTDVRGFAACIYRGGGRAFTLDYRHAGRQRRMTFGRWPEWSVSAARERAKEIRREIDAGADPLAQRGALREAPRVNDLIERYCAEHLPKLAERNAADQRSSLAKLVAPVWGRKLVTEITPTDVDKLLNKIAEGRARPHKEKPNNRARKLQPAKPTPVRANRIGRGAAQDVHAGGRMGLVRRTTPPSAFTAASRPRASGSCPRRKSPAWPPHWMRPRTGARPTSSACAC